MDQAIRRMTDDEQEAEIYRRLHDAEVERRRADYEAEFGPEFRLTHPFQPTGVHEAVMEQIEAMKQYD